MTRQPSLDNHNNETGCKSTFLYLPIVTMHGLLIVTMHGLLIVTMHGLLIVTMHGLLIVTMHGFQAFIFPSDNTVC